MEGGTPLLATHKYAAMWSLLTLVIDNISPSTTFTIEPSSHRVWRRRETIKKVKRGNCLQKENENVSGNLAFALSPFSPLIDISSPSSRRHITYGSGNPFALHVNVTFVPSLTTISLLVIDSTITGGTEIRRGQD
jgi:hypothetical protein